MMIGLYRSMSNIIVDILEDKELDVEFLYSVTWKKIDISFVEGILTICFLLDCLIAYWTITKMVISALHLAKCFAVPYLEDFVWFAMSVSRSALTFTKSASCFDYNLFTHLLGFVRNFSYISLSLKQIIHKI
ncbi:unnamed protein product [Musa acuminata subsp. burmannicoides]